MARLERTPAATIHGLNSTNPLPVLSVNHISFAVPCPTATSNFFQRVLGFRALPQPDTPAFRTSEWLCGLGLEIHFVQRPLQVCRDSRPTAKAPSEIDPRNDHISFLCPNKGPNSPWRRLVNMLEQANVEYIERDFPDLDMRQLFFSDPTSGILIEISTNPKC